MPMPKPWSWVDRGKNQASPMWPWHWLTACTSADWWNEDRAYLTGGIWHGILAGRMLWLGILAGRMPCTSARITWRKWSLDSIFKHVSPLLFFFPGSQGHPGIQVYSLKEVSFPYQEDDPARRSHPWVREVWAPFFPGEEEGGVC